MKISRLLFTVFVALSLILAACSSPAAPAPVARSGENTKVYFTDNGATLALASGGKLDGQSGSSAFLDLTTLNMAKITPTSGSTLTPTHTFYEVNSAGAITMTLGTTGAVAGQLLYLYGDDNYTVTINDTNIRSSDGNAVAIGQYDMVVWIFEDTEWIELLKIANQ